MPNTLLIHSLPLPLSVEDRLTVHIACLCQVAAFFRLYGETLLSSPEVDQWRGWFALAYLPSPEKQSEFKVCVDTHNACGLDLPPIVHATLHLCLQ